MKERCLRDFSRAYVLPGFMKDACKKFCSAEESSAHLLGCEREGTLDSVRGTRWAEGWGGGAL